MEVAFFKEQPHNVLVWDAQAVIDYLKKEDLYKEYDKDDIKTIDALHICGGMSWIKRYRTAK